MKKRLLMMLLLLCLLLTALTATVSAFTVEVNGKKVNTTLVIEYSCGICNTRPMLDDEDYTINSFQAYTADGTPKPLAEWKYGDGLVLSVTIENTSCSVCKAKNVNTPIQGGTFNVVIEAAHVGYYCHKKFDYKMVKQGNFRFRFTPVDYLFTAEHHAAGLNSCENDGYKQECWICPSCGKCFNKAYTHDATEIPDNIISKLGHEFNDAGFCTRCEKQAEAYIYNPTTKAKSYCATAAEAIADAGRGEAVIVVSYPADKKDPIVLNKIVGLTVNNGVTVPEIRLDALSGTNTGDFVNINNYGTVNLLSSATEAQQSYPTIFIFNHSAIDEITVSNAIAQNLTISNTKVGTINKIDIPRTTITSRQVQISNSGTITSLSGCTGNVTLRSGSGSYGTIKNASTNGTADQLLDTGCYLYFPKDGKKWVNSNAGSPVSDAIVSYAPFTVNVKQGDTELKPSEGSYTIDGVNVGDNVALSAAFALNPSNSGLTVDESEISSRWYYKGERKTAADGTALTLNNIQYGVYDLIFEAKESTYGFTTSINVKVNVIPPKEKTKISLKTQLTSDSYTKVYDGTTNTKGILPPIEFQLADEREIRISPDYYTATAEYKSPDCIDDNKIIVTVTLTPAGENYYTLTDGKIEVPATITPYDGEWVGDIQYKAFSVGSNSSLGSPHVGDPVLPYLQLSGMMYNTEMGRLYPRKITSKDGFQYSFYHLRPGATEPDPELDELLTADSVFTYPEEGYNFYAVVEPSLNYTGCITNSTADFFVYDKYNGNSHTHDNEKTYDKWAGGSLSIASGGTATRYLSGAQPNVNVELALSHKKTLDLCLYNKAVHVIGSSHDQIYLVGGSTLVLSDCRKTGKVIGSAVASGSGGVAYVKNGTLSVYDVTLTGGIAKNGGAIVVDKDGTLNLYSGEISGNYVTGGKGGAIYVKSGGVVNMYGGTIQNNHAYSGNGGAIYVAEGGTLNLYGGEISGNTASGLGGGIYVETGGMVNVKGAPIVKDNTANGKPSNLCICVSSSSPLLSISGDMTDGAQIGISTDASCPVLLAGGMQTDYSAYFIPDEANTFVFYTDQALTLCAKPTATLEGDTLTITTGSGNTFVLLAAEYDTDGKMLAVHSWNVAPQKDTYTCNVKNPGVKIKCFLLRATSYTPVLTPFSPLA